MFLQKVSFNHDGHITTDVVCSVFFTLVVTSNSFIKCFASVFSQVPDSRSNSLQVHHLSINSHASFNHSCLMLESASHQRDAKLTLNVSTHQAILAISSAVELSVIHALQPKTRTFWIYVLNNFVCHGCV